MRLTTVAGGALLFLGLCTSQAQPTGGPGDCLYATSDGGSVVTSQACPDSDPLNIANDPRVKAVMQAFQIDPATVRFSGCPSQKFRLGADAQGVATKYVVYYSTAEPPRMLAPLIHELAHIAQSELAGGREYLFTQFKAQPFSSRRIELEADFLTGAMFARLFPALPLRDFEQNLILAGQYDEGDRADAHGTQEQRQSAFGFGAHSAASNQGSIGQLSKRFQRRIYAQIVGHLAE